MILADAAVLHEIAGTWTAERVQVENAEVELFSRRVSRFIGGLGESREDAFWAGVCRMLRRARWDMATVPLPINSEAIGLPELAAVVVPRLRRCADVAPTLTVEAMLLADQLERLCTSNDDSLGDMLRRLLVEARDRNGDVAERIGVLIRDGRNVQAVRYVLPEDVAVVAPSQLQGEAPFGRIIAIGPVAWFPPAVLRSPRASDFSFVYYGWLSDPDPDLGLLVGSAFACHNGLHPAPVRERGRSGVDDLDEPATNWVPEADWRAIAAQGRGRSAEDHAAERVSAWLFALASDQGVFIDAVEGSRAYVAELEDEINVHQVLVSDIEPGTYVVLRTEGEGDYIRVIADVLLGYRARRLRELQRWWKEELGRRLQARGVRAVVRALDAAGAVRASEENVRRWAAPDNLRTQDEADFRAILTVVAATERFAEIWDAMGILQRAHQQAGTRVRALLVDQIRDGDTTTLRQRGWADYDVEEIEGEGALRVARVDARAPATQDVPRTRLRRPFAIDRDLWLA